MRLSPLIVLALLVALVSTASAGTGHYLLGSTGLNNGTVPGPGTYLTSFNYFYQADEFRDRNGQIPTLLGRRIDLGVDFFITAAAITHVTKKKLWGGTYGFSVLAPYMDLQGDINLGGALALSDRNRDFSDLYVEPLNLSWHDKRTDKFVSYGLYAPTGEFVPRRASTTKDFWTHQISGGLTHRLGDKMEWAFSVVPRLEFHGGRESSDGSVGDNLNVEWGFARNQVFLDGSGRMPNHMLSIGPVGFFQWQLDADSGAPAILAGVKNHNHGAGAELTFTRIQQKPIVFTARHLEEFDVRARTKGQITTVALTLTL
jgi:hypothetical protein